MPALTAQHLRKSYGPQVVLDDASFTLVRGEKVGLIGANGAGKSTLSKLLAGAEVPDGGSVSVRRGLTIRYLPQEPVLDPAASPRAVVAEALSAWTEATKRYVEVSERLAAKGNDEALVQEQAALDDTIQHLGGWERGHEALGFLDKLGVRDVERPCGERSGGEKRRIALAQLLVAAPDVAIVDEPTNHLDADTVEWLEEYFTQDYGGAIVLVTHDRYFLDAVVDRIIELERGRLSTYPGGYGDYLEKKAELMAHEGRVEQNRQNVLRREREWLSRGPKARSTKQKARIQRAHALEAQGPATAGRPGEVSLVGAAGARQGKTTLELHGLQLAGGEGAPPLHAPFDLILTAGERIGIVGPNGAGKTTLLRAVLAAAGEPVVPAAILAGSIVVGKNTKVAYLDQMRGTLDDDKSIFDDVRGEGGTTVVRLGASVREEMDLRSYLELFLFDGQKQRQKVGSLSGGERARVALAKVLREGANLLVFDEPTNDLDLPTLAALEGMLQDYSGSVIVVTHDRAFLDRVAMSVLAFEGGSRDALATVTRYAGGYSDYVAQRSRKPEPVRDANRKTEPPSSRSTQSTAPAKPSAPPPGLTFAEKKELAAIVADIDRADQKVSALEKKLADPSLYSARGPEAAKLQAELVVARAEAARLVGRWEALETKKGA
jgi:ABC transport system ATP-binding/permease protein